MVSARSRRDKKVIRRVVGSLCNIHALVGGWLVLEIFPYPVCGVHRPPCQAPACKSCLASMVTRDLNRRASDLQQPGNSLRYNKNLAKTNFDIAGFARIPLFLLLSNVSGVICTYGRDMDMGMIETAPMLCIRFCYISGSASSIRYKSMGIIIIYLADKKHKYKWT